MALELLPGWARGRLYWLRRSFLLRTRRFGVGAGTEGWHPLDVSSHPLPHGPVRVLPRLSGEWSALELRGRRMRWERLARWQMWFERRGESVELVLPYQLRDVELRVHPPSSLRPGDALVIQELGPFRSGFPTRAVGPGGVPDGAAYHRWLAAFEAPGPASLRQLATRARGSGLRLTLVGAGEGESARGIFPAEQLQQCSLLEQATGEVIVTVPPGAALAPHALAAIACVFADHPEAAVVHADDDVLTAGGRARPSFKPSWSPELLRARNYLPGLVAFRRSVLPPGGGPLDASTRYRLLLELGERLPPAAFCRLPAVLASLPPDLGADPREERDVLAAHLESTGVRATVEDGLAAGLRRVRYALPRPVPRVSIIVPTRNSRALVEACVRSVRSLTAYPDFEITLVDNGSDDPDALAAFEALARQGLVRLRSDPRPFNYAALNNQAVRESDGALVCLLNNDIEAVHADWLEEMAGIALQPGVGAVGAKLLYPDGRIQHGGVLVGVYDAADHLYAGVPGGAPGLDAQLLVRREVSAVTAACLVVRRSLYLEVGGLDEDRFPVGFNDVDFCLKLRALGLRNVWTPHARLIHHESATRGRSVSAEQKARLAQDTAALQELWGTGSFEDPYFSPNLSLDWIVPELAWAPRRRPWAAGCASGSDLR